MTDSPGSPSGLFGDSPNHIGDTDMIRWVYETLAMLADAITRDGREVSPVDEPDLIPIHDLEKRILFDELRSHCRRMYFEADAEYRESGCIADMEKSSGLFNVVKDLDEKVNEIDQKIGIY